MRCWSGIISEANTEIEQLIISGVYFTGRKSACPARAGIKGCPLGIVCNILTSKFLVLQDKFCL